MNRPASRQRREQYVWKRFVSDNSRQPALELIERPNPDIFRNIMNKHAHEWNDEVRMRAENLKINMENEAWNRVFTPHQKIVDEFPISYNGARHIGRSYGCSFSNIKSEITNTLYFDTHRYLDMVCCFPTIICEAFGHLDLPALTGYVFDRESVFQGFYDQHGLKKADIKSAINSMIGSCPKMSTCFGLGTGAEEKARILSEHPYTIAIQGELCAIANEIQVMYPDFYVGMMEHARINGKADHAKGSMIAYFCQDIEDAIMRTCFKVVQDGHADSLAKEIVWKFDGAMFPKTMVYDGEEIIQRIQQSVFAEHGLHVRFSFKDISSPDEAYQDCGVEIVIDAYKRWKAVFDRTYVKFWNPDAYGMMQPDGTYRLLSYGQSGSGGAFGFITNGENEEFIKRWVTDPDKIIYKGMDFAPPPLVTKPGHLNTFRGFAAAHDLREMDEAEIDRRWKMWDTHVDLLCNHEEESVSYLHRHIASIIQRPGEKTEVLVFIRSIQGTGKDQFFKMLNGIIGPSMCHSASHMKEIMGNKSAILENKLVVTISESSSKDFQDYYEDMKHIVTRETFTVMQKYVKEYVNRCNVNLFVATNNFSGMGFSTKERRIFAIQADGRYANDPAYHEPFDAYIKDRANQVAVYRKYMAMDLTGFKTMSQRPVTKVLEEMASTGGNHMAFFLRRNFNNWISYARTGSEYSMASADYLRVRNQTFFEEWYGYCQEMKMKNIDTKRKAESFGTQLLAEAASAWQKYCPDGVVPMSNSKVKISGKSDRAKVFYVTAVQEWINETANSYVGAGDDEGEEETKMDATPWHSKLVASHNKPGESPKYVVKKGGNEVFGSDDLEEINRYLGEAYVKKREDGSLVLIHQFRDNKEYDVEGPYDENTKTKLEMTYPWYRKSRIS
jgi:hypothetical protein